MDGRPNIIYQLPKFGQVKKLISAYFRFYILNQRWGKKISGWTFCFVLERPLSPWQSPASTAAALTPVNLVHAHLRRRKIKRGRLPVQFEQSPSTDYSCPVSACSIPPHRFIASRCRLTFSSVGNRSKASPLLPGKLAAQLQTYISFVFPVPACLAQTTKPIPPKPWPILLAPGAGKSNTKSILLCA
jgi:hypothetical protein